MITVRSYTRRKPYETQRKRVRMDLSLYRLERELEAAVEAECEAEAALREARLNDGFDQHLGMT